VRPWLPLGDLAACNVESQRSDPASVLTLVRRLIALRRQEPDLHAGAYRPLAAPEGVWAWSRGDRHFVALNMTDARVDVPGLAGTVQVSTAGERSGQAVTGSRTLDPWEGIIGVMTAPAPTAR
jgi:alpha-glucosidase